MLSLTVGLSHFKSEGVLGNPIEAMDLSYIYHVHQANLASNETEHCSPSTDILISLLVLSPPTSSVAAKALPGFP